MVRILICLFVWPLGAMACATESGPQSVPPVGRSPETMVDAGLIQAGEWNIPSSVRGAVPDTAQGPPSFTGVMNHHGQAVTQEALLGHFSVLWFYPLANTSG